ncbi:MAG: translation initiation factor IF-2 [Candidatus Omnitrophica bacterium CG02_land_8_20_14_3_00__42_8]|nr:MAG: translation initiation factor IF-2 [Candidatus Omnitrophica bacterium CG02_land_8_20_14_3_00__42_8]
MMGIRVHELAKELGVSSKELIDKLHALKIDVKGHMSALDDDTAFLVKEELKPSPTKARGITRKHVKVKGPEKKAKAPAKVKAPKKAKEPKIEAKEPKIEAVKVEAPKVEEKKIGIKEQKIEEIKEEHDTAGTAQCAVPVKVLKIDFPIVIKDIAIKLCVRPADILKKLLDRKVLATINQALDEETTRSICGDFGYTIEKLPSFEETYLAGLDKTADPKKLRPRAPVVTFMGHVDHGKTSLLDAIRKTKVVDKEAGGITQHIGAYEVMLPKGNVTFLDTPGHAAFTAMRARGANVTDIVVLVVAADDGIMPQTIEAINHARAAGVTIVVAINKIDKQNINLDKVKKQLVEQGLTPEEWGGKTITVGVSAKTGQGIDSLLEMLLLEAELLELKANPEQSAVGVVIEAGLSKGKGPIATVLVSNGTLKIGDTVIAGLNYGRIKAMLDDKGRRVMSAGPVKPVEILGLSGAPKAGERFYVIADEKKARDIAAARQMEAEKKKLAGKTSKITLEELYNKIKAGEVKELKIVIKADVQGSLEAIKGSLERLSTEEVKLSVMHSQVGDINESDVMLASASNAIILGFHVNPTSEASALAKQEEVEIRIYSIIYEIVDEVQAAMEGMLEPVIEEVFLGRAEVRQVFNVSKTGVVAGCFISKGRVPRDAVCKLIREKEIVFKGKMSSLKHFKDDLKEAKEGFECGISLGFKDIQKGDLIEAIEVRKVARRLK